VSDEKLEGYPVAEAWGIHGPLYRPSSDYSFWLIISFGSTRESDDILT